MGDPLEADSLVGFKRGHGLSGEVIENSLWRIAPKRASRGDCGCGLIVALKGLLICEATETKKGMANGGNLSLENEPFLKSRRKKLPGSRPRS